MSEPVPLDTLRHVETPEGITLTLGVAGPMARARARSSCAGPADAGDSRRRGTVVEPEPGPTP